MTSVSDLVALLDERFPRRYAEDWDRVGLTVGDPADSVTTVAFAVDPTLEVVDEALARGAQLLVTHHPLLLRGVHEVATTAAKGAIVHKLIKGGCALYSAHTNADAAPGGVADALAQALGLRDVRPLVSDTATPEWGTGRVGTVSHSTTVADLAQRLAEVLPVTVTGVRVAGDPNATVTTVGLVGGAGDSYISEAIAQHLDVYITGDLRHHPVLDAREHASLQSSGAPHLIDISHYAAESLWLTGLAQDVANTLSVKTYVSSVSTDPWTARFQPKGA